MKKLVLYSLLMIVLLTGCRALPERNYVGMTRDQVIETVAETPKEDWGEHSKYLVLISNSPYELDANVTLYFKSINDIKKDPRVRKAKLLGVYYQKHWSGYRFFYELILKDNLVVEQKISYTPDGVKLLPAQMFHDYPGKKTIGK